MDIVKRLLVEKRLAVMLVAVGFGIDIGLYTLTPGDLVAICKEFRLDAANQAINKVRRMFQNDRGTVVQMPLIVFHRMNYSF